MNPTSADEAELSILEHAIDTFDVAADSSDRPAFDLLFERTKAFCELRLDWQYAAALLLSAYSKHPSLRSDSSLYSEFMSLAERCWKTGVAADVAHWQVGLVEFETGDTESSLDHFRRVDPEALGPFWGGIALEYRVACIIRLRRMADVRSALQDFVLHLERHPKHTADALALDRVLREAPDVLRSVGAPERELLQRIASMQRFRWFNEESGRRAEKRGV